MERGIQVFNNPQFGAIRTTGTAEEPMFCASDICRALGYTNGRKAIADHCDEGDVTKRDTPTSSGVQTMTFVNESGLYSLIFGSKLESAKQFKKWVTSEVLPSIRKTGSYSIQNLSRKQLALMVIEAEEEKERLSLENKKQADIIEEQKPKVVFADAVQASNDCILIRQLVKFIQQNGVKIGEQKLFDWLHDEGYLCQVGVNKHVPTEKSMRLKVMSQKENVIVTGSTTFTSITPLITTKGQMYFLNKHLKREPSLFD